jgi:hypothetical protein
MRERTSSSSPRRASTAGPSSRPKCNVNPASIVGPVLGPTTPSFHDLLAEHTQSLRISPHSQLIVLAARRRPTFDVTAFMGRECGMIATLLPPGQAVFATVVKFTPKRRVRGVESAPSRLQLQLDGLNRSPHPAPYRKPLMRTASQGAILLALENVHFSQAEADASSLSWAWQIAHEACISEFEWDAGVCASQRVTPHRRA